MPLRNWLQLALTEGIGPILLQRLIAVTGSPAAACTARESDLRAVEGIGNVKSGKILESLHRAADQVDAELDAAKAANAHLICPEDGEYPALLRIIPDPPPVLYVQGSLQPRDLNALAIVGSRRCSQYGREQADRFAALLAGTGFTIVSGGARGVDSAAHRGAMSLPTGRTVAVLGCGIDVIYPPENASLFRQIADQGAVITEFPIATPPLKENFPRRNRIVSGMSRGVLVVEADLVSGALITARQACDDHGRPVFAIPGRVDNAMSAGPHELIRHGAALVTELSDVLDGLGPLPAEIAEPDQFAQEHSLDDPPARETMEASRDLMPGMSERQKQIFKVLETDPTSVDGIITETGLPAEIVLQELTLMTLRGVVKRVDGQNFARRS